MKVLLILFLFSPDLAKQRSIMHRSADRILRSEFSELENLDWTKIRTWLHNKDSKESEYAIVESWMLEGNTGNSEQVFDAISSTFNLTGDALAQHDSYEDWMDLRISFKTQQKDVYNLGSSDVLLIQNIADNAFGIAAAQTQGLLNHAYGYDYFLKPVPPSGQQLVAPPISNVAASSSVFAFPNPAKESVQFSWQLPKSIEDGIIQVSDMQGRLIWKATVTGHYGSLDYDTKEMDAGIYFFNIRFFNGASTQEKLVIIK